MTNEETRKSIELLMNCEWDEQDLAAAEELVKSSEDTQAAVEDYVFWRGATEGVK